MSFQKKLDQDQNLHTSDLPNLHKLANSSLILPNHSVQNKAVIFKLKTNSQAITPNSTKLKSLLPKSLSNPFLRNGQNESFQIFADSDMQNATTMHAYSAFTNSTIEDHSKSSSENKISNNQINKEFSNCNAGRSNETVEDMLAHYNTNSPGEQSYDKHSDMDKCSNITPEPLQTDAEVLEPQTLMNSIQPSNPSQNSSDSEHKVVKKSKIEAYVKMVVCRKITIQKVLLKTDEVLETKVKTEEEEPVILDVDCVETTEDMLTDSAELSFDNTSELAASKWTASLDGGLKFLSAVSESRQKIGKNCIKDKILESPFKKLYNISNLLESASHKDNSSKSLVDESHLEISLRKEYKLPLKTEHLTDSENDEWNGELNDDSEDYVPTRNSLIKSKNQTCSNDHDDDKLKLVKNESLEESIILIPKKRGRKRKWDNALGMSSNLRSCVFCNKHFNNTTACSEHMKLGNCISSVFCFICSKPFSNENELEKHLQAHCTEKKPKLYECVDCYRSYRTRAGYEKHFRMGTCLKRDDFEDFFTGPLQCDLCPSRFSTQAYLRLHRYKVHENPKDTHTCHDCGKKFYSSVGYYKHKNGRPCTEPLKCWVCGKTYSSKAKESFKIHMKHHKSEVGGVTFNCDECGRGYMTQMALTKHKLSHTGVKPYKCETCGKAFAMRYMVKDHARTHTGERPYLCSLCGNAFSNKGHLGRHLRSHENRTLQKRGRPKKIKEAGDELKIIDLGQTLQGLDGQSIQLVNSQLFDSQVSGTPMIIQTNDNTIIIADGWPPSSIISPAAMPLPNS